jgi:hypothetical protein
LLVSSLTSFGSAGGEALQGHSKVLAILHRGAKRAILTRVHCSSRFRVKLEKKLKVPQGKNVQSAPQCFFCTGMQWPPIHCKKELAVFPSPAGMSLIKLFLGGNNLVFSRPERVWSVTSRLGTGKWITLFYSVRAQASHAIGQSETDNLLGNNPCQGNN